MSVTSSSTVVGVFGNRAVAEQAMDALSTLGFERESMHELVPGSSAGFFEELKSFFTGNEPAPTTDEDKLARNLMGLGLSNEQARYYAQAYNQGYTLLTVQTAGREQEVLGVLYQYGAAQQQVASTAVPGSYANSPYTNSTPAWANQETEAQVPVARQEAATPSQEVEEHPHNTATPAHGLDMEDAQGSSSTYAEHYVGTSTRPENYGETSNSVNTPEQDTTAEYSTNREMSEQDKGEVETPEQEVRVSPARYQTSTEEEDEYATPEYLTSAEEDYNTTSAYQTAEEEDQDTTPTYKTPAYAGQSENSAYKAPEQLDEVSTPAYQSHEQTNGFATPAYQMPLQSHGFSSSTSPTGVDTPEQTDQAEMPVYQTQGETSKPQNANAHGMAPMTNTTSDDFESRLQQLRERVRSTQQQLQDTKAQLEAARRHETEYQQTHKQLQELQAELDSTSQELQQARERLAQYHS